MLKQLNWEKTKTRAEIGTQECEVISTVSFLGIIITRTGALPNTLHAARNAVSLCHYK